MEKVSRAKKRCSSLFGLYDGRTIHTACLPIRAYQGRMRLGEGDADGGGEEGGDDGHAPDHTTYDRSNVRAGRGGRGG